ncbi:MAG: hypothetical protein AAF907_00470 [Planctomycetota bacterium]
MRGLLTLSLFASAFAVDGFAQEIGGLLKTEEGTDSAPLVDSSVSVEQDGVVVVEAEDFATQTRTDVRAFYLTTEERTPDVAPDGDPNHAATAAGGAYLEILPDTRRTHDDKLEKGENFIPEPGAAAVLSYPIRIQTPGRYYVWVRAFSTGTEDNGLHVGLNGKWPESGRRMQWCKGKRTWRWESKQRTAEEHCGEPYRIYLDIDEPGDHAVLFSMREDGFEFDRFLMTSDRDYVRPEDAGPKPSPKVSVAEPIEETPPEPGGA